MKLSAGDWPAAFRCYMAELPSDGTCAWKVINPGMASKHRGKRRKGLVILALHLKAKATEDSSGSMKFDSADCFQARSHRLRNAVLCITDHTALT